MLAPLVAQAAPLLTLSPAGGTLQGGRGAVVGWGFTLSNPDPDFLVVTSAEFCQTVVVAGFTVCDQLPKSRTGDVHGLYRAVQLHRRRAGAGEPRRQPGIQPDSADRSGEFRDRAGRAVWDFFRPDPADLRPVLAEPERSVVRRRRGSPPARPQRQYAHRKCRRFEHSRTGDHSCWLLPARWRSCAGGEAPPYCESAGIRFSWRACRAPSARLTVSPRPSCSFIKSGSIHAPYSASSQE